MWPEILSGSFDLSTIKFDMAKYCEVDILRVRAHTLEV